MVSEGEIRYEIIAGLRPLKRLPSHFILDFCIRNLLTKNKTNKNQEIGNTCTEKEKEKKKGFKSNK